MVSVIKCVVVGDEAVGKTSALVTHSTNTFHTEYVPTVFDNYLFKNEVVNDYAYDLNMFDTSGRESNDEIRALCYQNTDVFLVCFSVAHPESFENVRQKWVPEIRRYCGLDARYILVGTQTDLRNDYNIIENLFRNNTQVITREDGERLARELFAVKYVECSALTPHRLKHVFDEAILAAISGPCISLAPETTETQLRQQRQQHCPIL